MLTVAKGDNEGILTIATTNHPERIDDAILKMTDDGRVKAIQEKWLGTYTELPREVPKN